MQDPIHSYVSHELRTLISAIFASTDLLAESVKHHRESVDLVNVIRQNSSHVLNLMNNALDLSKIEAGKMAIEQMACEPGQVVAEVVSLMQPTAAEKGLLLTAQCQGRIPQTIVTDPMRLRQILLNLVDNAVKFTDRGGVRLCVQIDPTADRTDEGKLSITIKDSGIGIQPEHLQHVLDPFVQADSSTARYYGGTGLGLAISKRLARLLGGDLVISSRPKAGSTVTVTIATGPLENVTLIEHLPQLTLGSLAVNRSVNAGRRTGPRLDGVRLLLMEDRPGGQLLVSVILKSAGARVKLACGIDAAVDEVIAAQQSDRPFDLLLIALDACEPNGVTELRQVQRHANGVPIVAVADRLTTSQRSRWLEAGCVDCLATGSDASRFITAVARAIVSH